VDVTLGYNLFRQRNADITATSDEMGETVFHELTHAAHHNKVGNVWWDDFVKAEINQMTTGNSPYGFGNAGATSQIIALGESWAYHMGHFLSDRKYGLISSPTDNLQFIYNNNSPITNYSSHLNALEDFGPNRTAFLDRWIPQGLYLDLIDTRNEPGPVPVIDGVSNFNNQQLFNALDPDIRTMLQYRDRLIGENPNNQTVAVRNLFAQYNIQ